MLGEVSVDMYSPKIHRLQLPLLDRRLFLIVHSTQNNKLHHQMLAGEPIKRCRQTEELRMIELPLCGGGGNNGTPI